MFNVFIIIKLLILGKTEQTDVILFILKLFIENYHECIFQPDSMIMGIIGSIREECPNCI